MKITTGGTKDLPDEIAAETGFKRGIFITEETPHDSNSKCDFVDEQGRKCDEDAWAYENTIVGVIDGEGNSINLSAIDPIVRIILQTANQKVQLCIGHILKVIEVDEIGEHVKRNDDAGQA